MSLLKSMKILVVVNCQTQVTAVILISVTRKVVYCYLVLVMTVMWVMVLIRLALIFWGEDMGNYF